MVDGNRIGSDVAPSWLRADDGQGLAGYESALPATRHALHATLARSFMHRRLWLNDPDCLMLRSAETDLGPEAARTWARAVALSGGMVLVSDDLALLDDDATAASSTRRWQLGRRSDEAALAGTTPRCDDLMRHRDVGELTAVGQHLVVDAGHGPLHPPPRLTAPHPLITFWRRSPGSREGRIRRQNGGRVPGQPSTAALGGLAGAVSLRTSVRYRSA